MASIQIPEAWPQVVQETSYVSTADGSSQRALAFRSPEKGRRPLLVGLHTWSFTYKQTDGETLYAKWCLANGWHFIHPDFRGPNNTPQALGSELAVSDIVDAVALMKRTCDVDEERVYLVGVSGGGHASLLLAGRRPDLWAGVSAWCGISDLREWHAQCRRAPAFSVYADHIEAACGGNPDEAQEAAMECVKRSPISYLSNAKGVNLDINAGAYDGRKGSVPFSHSLHAFNLVAEPGDTLSAHEIDSLYKDLRFPKNDALQDPLYGTRQPLFRRVSGNARATIFDGGHEIVHVAALNWLARQRRGVKATWDIPDPIAIEATGDFCAAGK